jgi:predicted nuclease of predicted toxin-antitoxin system
LKLKLDENLGLPLAAIFRRAGHDTATVPEQQLSGSGDLELIERCRDEGRAIVTLDMDFSNPLVFKPSRYHGIAVLGLPKRASFDDLAELARTLIEGLTRESLEGELWIVERGRIRVYQEEAH